MKPICGVCDCGPETCELRAPAIGWVEDYGLPKVVCSDCLAEWYDGTEKNHGSWESVAEYVRRKRTQRLEMPA